MYLLVFLYGLATPVCFSSRSAMFVYILDGVEATLKWSNNRLVFFRKIATWRHILDDWEGIKQVFLSLIPRNIVKVASEDFTKESTSMSVESTFEALIIAIDIRLYQYSCVDFIKWQEKGKIMAQACRLSVIVREANTVFEDLLHPFVRKLFLHLKEATLHLQWENQCWKCQCLVAFEI